MFPVVKNRFLTSAEDIHRGMSWRKQYHRRAGEAVLSLLSALVFFACLNVLFILNLFQLQNVKHIVFSQCLLMSFSFLQRFLLRQPQSESKTVLDFAMYPRQYTNSQLSCLTVMSARFTVCTSLVVIINVTNVEGYVIP